MAKTTILGIDTGGTFTDVFCLDPAGTVRTLKLPTSTGNPATAIVAAVDELSEKDEHFHCVHGTTVATNALLERKGARTALLTTRGFRDLLTLGRGQRPQLYALEPFRPEPLITPELCLEADERISVAGEVLVELDLAQIEALGRQLVEARVEAVAVCFLFSHVFPQHEKAAGEVLRSLGLAVFLSHELCPEEREYERASTTAVSAYLSRCLTDYLVPLEREMSARGSQSLSIVHSGGARISVGEACQNPAGCVLSGPAAGVRGAFAVARQAGVANFLCLDMGGTSTDVAICKGGLPYISESSLDGVPVRQLSVDIHTIGAGGGSIVRLDAGGALVVGPESVGSIPGPAAYGRGTLPCVTDANVILGRLPLSLAGGRVTLQPECSRAAFQPLADRLGLSVEATAEAALAVVRSSMERALRRVSLERGHDPRDFTLLAYGGAGSLHAVELADLLGCRQVLIPRHPGLLCALGAALSPWLRQFSRSLHLPLEHLESAEMGRWIEELAAQAHKSHGPGRLTLQTSLDLRYRGQGQTLSVDFKQGAALVEKAARGFEKQHLHLFGYTRSRSDIEAVSLRLRASGSAPELPAAAPAAAGRARAQATRIYWQGSEIQASAWQREELTEENRLEGPSVVHQNDSTLFLPPGWEGRGDKHGNLILSQL